MCSFHGLHFINYSSKYNHFNGISLRQLIKNLLYREYSRTTMIVSKIITLFIISLIYFVITIIASNCYWVSLSL